MATRIKDGIFVADGESSQDGEFVEMNKISYVINYAGRQLPNLWAPPAAVSGTSPSPGRTSRPQII